MKIRILSDVHNEFELYYPPDVQADVTVLAGDIHTKARSAQWALEHFSGPIVLVAGNHEFYTKSIDRIQAKLHQAALESGGRLHFLEKNAVTVDGVRFLGATAWTDYAVTGNASLAMWDAAHRMNDHRLIRVGPSFHRWTPRMAACEAGKTRLWLEQELAKPFEGKTVLVTHHPLSSRSLDPEYPRSHLDAAYANGWEHLMGDHLTLAIHGHTHHACDYDLNGTRVVSNPKGYPGESTGFNPALVVEI